MMKKIVLTIGVLMLIVMTAVSCSILQEPEEASQPIEAIPLEIEATSPPPTEVPPTEEPTEEPMEEPTDEPIEEPTEEPMEEPTNEPPEEPTAEPPQEEETEASSQGLVIFQIVPIESQVRFELDEDLRGSRITVIGTTDQVAGELAVDFGDLSNTQAGALQINARTLATDNDFRNRAIKNEILKTNDYEFITFTPTAVTGLPDSVQVGDTIIFTIVGDLTIKDITQEETFTVEATAVSDTELTGTAGATIQRGDYGLNIPSVPNVANVEEEVELYIDFIARVAQ